MSFKLVLSSEAVPSLARCTALTTARDTTFTVRSLQQLQRTITMSEDLFPSDCSKTGFSGLGKQLFLSKTALV